MPQTCFICSDSRKVRVETKDVEREKYSRDLEEGWVQIWPELGRERTAETVHAGIS